MPRRGSLFWAVVAVLVAGTLVYGPAELARRSTGQGEPVDEHDRDEQDRQDDEHDLLMASHGAVLTS